MSKENPIGSQSNPYPWVPPYPAPAFEDDGKTEKLFVKAMVTQDVTLNGQKLPIGLQTLPCAFAHQHSAVLAAPPEVVPVAPKAKKAPKGLKASEAPVAPAEPSKE